MKHLALVLCLLAALACAKPPAPTPAKAAPPVLPQYKALTVLYAEFQTFRDDELYLRHGFTANFPRADWLARVQILERDPDLADGAHLLANLAIARRIHGNGSRITRDFETRFDRTLRGLPPEEEQQTPAAPLARTDDGTPPPVPAAASASAPVQTGPPAAESEPSSSPQGLPATQQELEPQPLQPAQAAVPAETTTEAQLPDQAETLVETPLDAQTGNQTASLTDAPAEPETTALAETASETAPEPPAQTPPATQPQTAPQSAEMPAPPTAPAQPVSLPETQPEPRDQAAAGSARPAEVTAPAQARSETPGKAPAPGVTILFSGDTQGVLYPQPGLSGAMGGIASRGPVIDRLRAEEPEAVLLDAGDAFTSGFPKAARINRALVRSMNRLGYDAMGLGGHDLAMGEVALRELVSVASFPLICTNLRFQQGVSPWIRDHVILERGGVRVAIVSLLPDESAVKITGASLVPARQALRNILPGLMARADCIVLLTQLDSARIAALPETRPAISAVIGDCRGAAMDDPLYLPTVPKGLGIGLLRLERDDRGPFRAIRSLPLLTGKTESPELLRLLDSLND